MKFDANNRWFVGIVSLLIATFLFVFVSNDNQNNIRSETPSESISHSGTEVIPNVPVEIRVDEEMYFVSGVPDSVTLRMDGPQSILAQTAITENYTIATPNLNTLGEGTHMIDLEVEDLPGELNASISPATIEIKVEERVSQSFNVATEFSENEFLADGHTVNNIELSEPTVQIFGAASTMERVSQVKVIVDPDDQEITDDFVTNGEVIVLDESGQPLDVNYEPRTVEVSVDVAETSKELPINLEQVGEGEPGYSYTISLAEGEPDTVIASGDVSTLDSMEEYDVNLDLSGVTESTTRNVAVINHDGITDVSEDIVQVDIEVNEEN